MALKEIGAVSVSPIKIPKKSIKPLNAIVKTWSNWHEGRIGPVIGRDDGGDTGSVTQDKNNPVLIGEPGVGKDCHRRRAGPRIVNGTFGRA